MFDVVQLDDRHRASRPERAPASGQRERYRIGSAGMPAGGSVGSGRLVTAPGEDVRRHLSHPPGRRGTRRPVNPPGAHRCRHRNPPAPPGETSCAAGEATCHRSARFGRCPSRFRCDRFRRPVVMVTATSSPSASPEVIWVLVPSDSPTLHRRRHLLIAGHLVDDGLTVDRVDGGARHGQHVGELLVDQRDGCRCPVMQAGRRPGERDDDRVAGGVARSRWRSARWTRWCRTADPSNWSTVSWAWSPTAIRPIWASSTVTSTFQESVLTMTKAALEVLLGRAAECP